MICRECPEGKRYAKGRVYCMLYGIIIREDCPCLPKRRKKDESGGGAANLRGGSEDETGLHTDGSSAAGSVPGVLSGSGE